jgi:hypothetical protein
MIQNFYYKNLQILEQMSYLEEVKKELIIFNFPQKNLHEHEHISFRKTNIFTKPDLGFI